MSMISAIEDKSPNLKGNVMNSFMGQTSPARAFQPKMVQQKSNNDSVFSPENMMTMGRMPSNTSTGKRRGRPPGSTNKKSFDSSF